MSLHHVLIAHASDCNRSRDRRIGIAIRYIPTSIRQTATLDDSATLVAGSDRYGHFRLEPRPQGPDDPAAFAYHRSVMEQTNRLLHRPHKEKQPR
jgi:hypothetical protein